MRPVPIPDGVVAAYPGSLRGIIAAPAGDDAVAPIEALFEGLVDGGFQRALVRLALEDGDLEKLTAGGDVWLVFGGPIPVFALDITPPFPLTSE